MHTTEALIAESRRLKLQIADTLTGIDAYLADLPPLKFAEIKLGNFGRGRKPMYEVVAPASRRVADPIKLFALLEGRPRKTFGRGELKLV